MQAITCRLVGQTYWQSVLISPFRPALLCAPSTHAPCELSSKIRLRKLQFFVTSNKSKRPKTNKKDPEVPAQEPNKQKIRCSGPGTKQIVPSSRQVIGVCKLPRPSILKP